VVLVGLLVGLMFNLTACGGNRNGNGDSVTDERSLYSLIQIFEAEFNGERDEPLYQLVGASGGVMWHDVIGGYPVSIFEFPNASAAEEMVAQWGGVINGRFVIDTNLSEAIYFFRAIPNERLIIHSERTVPPEDSSEEKNELIENFEEDEDENLDLAEFDAIIEKTSLIMDEIEALEAADDELFAKIMVIGDEIDALIALAGEATDSNELNAILDEVEELMTLEAALWDELDAINEKIERFNNKLAELLIELSELLEEEEGI